jgi:hypothetical protein
MPTSIRRFCAGGARCLCSDQILTFWRVTARKYSACYRFPPSSTMIQGQAIMDAIEAIKTRRCIRSYTEQSVAREIIEA